jgi:glycosyltransferase involved in cell wall biosynthesis
MLLRALALLSPAVALTVVGDGTEAERLRALAGSLHLGERVRWLGSQPQAALPELYRRAELVVAPAAAPEGLGLVGVEALLCETPVIASDLGGIRDIVETGRTGILVPPRDPAALARAITDALANPARREWGREGRTRMLDRFAPEACAVAYRSIYAEASRGAA